MWIVRLALRRKFTFVVLALFIALLGGLASVRMRKDILPVIDVPVVSVIWQFNGFAPTDMEKRIVTIVERAMTTTVNDIQHIESQSMPGIGVIKVYFQEGANPQAGVAQISAICETLLRPLPPGITPPLILQYNASTVPVLQMGVGSQSLSEQQLYDQATNFIRTQLATVQGASIPLPYGGKPRQIMVDLDIPALQAKGLSPADVSNAVNAQNLVLPAGTAKIGEREYNVRLNSSTNAVDELNQLPVRVINGAVVTIGDVAHVHDGSAVQTNVVNLNGKRAVLMSILKNGSASTLDVVSRVKAEMPHIKSTLPPDLSVEMLFDQSVFVRASVVGVIREAIIAACLTALMILLFLGSIRSTFVVALSIPLSILAAIAFLAALGQTINLMTLGGLALAVGILVDDATVEIENTNRNLAESDVSLTRAILESAEQIAAPAFVSTLSICIVFVPVAFLTGAARSLFLPLALAVVFSMMTSYLLSRTLVPVMMQYLLRKEVDHIREVEGGGKKGCDEKVSDDSQNKDKGKREEGKGKSGQEEGRKIQADNHGHQNGNGAKPKDDKKAEKKKPGLLERIHGAFNARFDRLRDVYCGGLTWALKHRLVTSLIFLAVFIVSGCLLPFIGEDFFPTVDAGQIDLHVQAPPGTRLEETEHLFHQVEDSIHQIIPKPEIDTVLDNIGLPVGGVNLAFSNSSTLGPLDGDILIALKEGKHGSTEKYIDEIRRTMAQKFPGATFYFTPPDITTQTLNFGLPAPIDVQVVGRDPGNYAVAEEIAKQAAAIPGAADVHIKQVVNAPEVDVNVDRQKAQQMGLTQRDVATDLLLSLTGSGQTSPNYWLDPKNGVSYLVAVQTPQYNMASIEDLENTPLIPGASAGTSSGGNGSSGQPPQLLSNLAETARSTSPQVINHYNVQPIYDIYMGTQGRDLGGVARAVNKIIDKMHNKLPKSTQVQVRGQVESMNSSFLGLGLGMIFAIVLVYLLMVVNFQSWLDPLVIIMALPGAMSGILWILFLTHTTFNVPSLMGTIMTIGVAVSNSILLITFANERRAEGDDAMQAAQSAGFTRLRPVMMTALALVLGMLPMALGLGEGGEQNAPLGRAVIGGVIFATFTTLFFVPVIYSVFRRKKAIPDDEEIEIDRYDADKEMGSFRKHEKLAKEDEDRNNGQDGQDGSEPQGGQPRPAPA